MLDPKVAPKLPPEQMKAPISPWVAHISAMYSDRMLPALMKALAAPGKALQSGIQGVSLSWYGLFKSFLMALVPVMLAATVLGTTWWYVVIHSQKDNVDAAKAVAAAKAKPAAAVQAPLAAAAPAKEGALQDLSASKDGGVQEPPSSGGVQAPPGADNGVQAPPGAEASTSTSAKTAAPEKDEPLQDMSANGEAIEAPKTEAVPEAFYTGFWIACALAILLLAWYYKNFDAEQYEILSMLVVSVMPLTILTFMVLGVILFGLTTATESAAVGAAGAFIMAWHAKSLTFTKVKEAVFLTAKTTSMVCWLFVGSALFSAVFAILGGQRLVEAWVLSMNLSPIQFMLLSQAIIFVLGWPLEWTEIIVIFVPIFLPLLPHFGVDPMLWGVLVFVNLQAAFLSPPVAMSAFYLKGVSPPHVTINQIFAGMMPYMFIVIICMVLMYIWPALTLWLPKYLYGG
jgi:TRAP-type mannitol/chloroaromatic compound transport system permease large subunit